VNSVLGLAVLLLAGFLGGKLANRLGLPAVTGYILAGVAVGPAALGWLDDATVNDLHALTDIALSIIALTIGGELSLRHLQKLGRGIVTISVIQALGPLVAVPCLLFFSRLELPVALLLGAIATATAPAATVAVIREYKAKGPLTQSLLAVVAIDDALCLVVFGLVFSAIKSMRRHETGAWTMLGQSALDIAGALVLGAVLALVLVQLLKRVKFHKSEILTITLGLAFLGSGLALRYHFSPLLLNMTLGAVLVNSSSRAREAFHALERVETPIYVAFFTLSGAALHLDVLLHLGVAGTLYILGRTAGKMVGAWLGATAASAPESVRRYLGLGLLPQAGVAIGLASMVMREFPEQGPVVSAIVLGSVVVFELVGPVAARIGLAAAGEMAAGGKKSAA